MGLFRKVWPKYNIADKVAFIFTHVGLIGICVFQLFVVLPIYHEPYSTWFYFHLTAGLFILLQAFTNMYKMILTDTTAKSGNYILSSILLPDWRYCNICQLNVPPRSHHCKICDECIIKRDHHCIFTGKCVGHSNHRYFFVMCCYLWIGCFYTLVFNQEYYFIKILGGYHFGLIFQFLCPMLAYLSGYANGHQLTILVVGGVNIVAMLLFTFLMGFQVFFISRGQTQFECKKKIKMYSKSFIDNWKVVLGRHWYLTWVSVLISSPLPNSGTDFKKSPPIEDVKSI